MLNRAGAWAVDFLCLLVLWAPWLLVARLVWELDDPAAEFGIFVAIAGPGLALAMVILSVLEGGPRQAGPGKRLFRLHIEDVQSGGAIGVKRAFLRRIVSMFDVIPLGAGWLWAFVDSRGQTWHDKVAHSVVRKSRFEYGSHPDDAGRHLIPPVEPGGPTPG